MIFYLVLNSLSTDEMRNSLGSASFRISSAVFFDFSTICEAMSLRSISNYFKPSLFGLVIFKKSKIFVLSCIVIDELI